MEPKDDVYQRYVFESINLNLVAENTGQMIWINTLASNLLPLDVNDYDYTEYVDRTESIPAEQMSMN